MQQDTSPSVKKQLILGASDSPDDAFPHDAELKAESILLEEFRYAASVVTQAQADRSNLFNLYLILAGIIISGAGTAVTVQVFDRQVLSILIGIGLLLASLLSFVFFIRLLRLGQKYHEGMMTMNVIKEFYLQQFHERFPLERVFRWRLATLPSVGNIGSSTFLIGFTMGLVGSFYVSAALGALVYAFFQHPDGFFLKLYYETDSFILSAPFFVLLCFAHFSYYQSYFNSLNKRR